MTHDVILSIECPPSSATDGETLFRRLTYEVAEIVKSMTLFTLNPDVHTVDIPPNSEEIEARGFGIWREILHATYGRCHSLELGENVTRLGIHVATIETWLDTYVFLHYPGQVSYWVHNRKNIISELDDCKSKAEGASLPVSVAL